MKTFEKIWDVIISLVVVYAMLYVTYVAAVVENPTNEQLADCILYTLCVLFYRMNRGFGSGN